MARPASDVAGNQPRREKRRKSAAPASLAPVPACAVRRGEKGPARGRALITASPADLRGCATVRLCVLERSVKVKFVFGRARAVRAGGVIDEVISYSKLSEH